MVMAMGWRSSCSSPARISLAAQTPSSYFEANVSNDELVLVRVDGGAVDLDARFLEHM